MWGRKRLGTDPTDKVFVSIVVEKVTLLKAKIVQLEVESALSVENVVVMLALANVERTQSQENKTPPNNREADSSIGRGCPYQP